MQMPALICCCTGLICSVAVNLHDHLPLLRTSMLILLHSPAAKLPEHQHNQLQVCLFSAASHSIYHYFFYCLRLSRTCNFTHDRCEYVICFHAGWCRCKHTRLTIGHCTSYGTPPKCCRVAGLLVHELWNNLNVCNSAGSYTLHDYLYNCRR